MSRARSTYEKAQIDGSTEGVVALDKVVQSPARQRYTGQVLRVDMAEDVVEEFRRKMR